MADNNADNDDPFGIGAYGSGNVNTGADFDPLMQKSQVGIDFDPL